MAYTAVRIGCPERGEAGRQPFGTWNAARNCWGGITAKAAERAVLEASRMAYPAGLKNEVLVNSSNIS